MIQFRKLIMLKHDLFKIQLDEQELTCDSLHRAILYLRRK